MKKLLFASLLFATSLFADSSIEMHVGGMTCGGCASGINETFLEDLPQYKAHVDYKTTILHVSTKDESDVKVAEIKSALNEMGFKGTLVKNSAHRKH